MDSLPPRLCRLVLALLLAPLPALAAPFAARLLLPDGTPAAGYTVTVVGHPLSAVCDAEGRFVLSPAPPAPFSLVASSPEGEVSAPLEVAALPVGLLDLSIPAALRDSITVVSGAAPSLDLLPGNAATVLTHEALEQRAPQRLYQVLEAVAGASKLGDGADSVPALRGLGRGRTLILLDGARVTAERRAGPSATFVEPASLASVEVLRGPGSVVYGSDALGGVLNAISRDPDPGRFGLRFSLEGAAGALDQRAGYLAASADVGRGGLLVEGHARQAEDAEAGGGEEIFNSSFEGWGAGVRYVRDTGPGRLRLGFARSTTEDLGKAAIDSRQIRAFYPEETSERLTASWIGVPGGGWDSLEAALFAGRYHIILDRDRAPTATSDRRIDRSDTDADDAALRTVAGREVGGGFLQLGVDAHSRFGLEAITGRTDFAADAATVVREQRTPSIADARQLTSGLFATWSRPLGASLSLGSGVRGDYVDTENRGGFFGDRAESDSAVTGHLALTAGPFAHWTTTLQAARGFRSPTLSDRYFRGPAGRGFVTGNPGLAPETSLQLDLATRYARGRHALGLYAYRYRIDDLIERFAEGDSFFFRNRGEATIEGLEIEAQAALGARWSGDLGFAWARGEADGGDFIDDIAAPNGWLTVRHSLPRGYVYARSATFLEHDEPGPTELARPGFTIFDLGAGFSLSDEIELRVTARNLGDRRYFASPDETADRAVGRSYTVGLSGRL
ncbi:MAG TPA: TonB-dependent receptor [Thermoanaerobaculia bacterium]|nr:TonB-dependent receptor [Thermoanaerobaculia bacterium]